MLSPLWFAKDGNVSSYFRQALSFCAASLFYTPWHMADENDITQRT
jgi:hypothetical protein